jgi:uncharacterized membrane protein YraQ (UPF0718 family)
MNFLYDAILKMTWLSDAIAWVLTQVGLDMSQRLVISIHYFIYDTIKIFLLLSVLIYTISYIQSYYPPERTRKILGRFNGFFARLLAALMGTITPFCSCSSIPLFIGFTKAGLDVGVTFSFLISSPLVDLASVFLLMSVFNPKIAIAYVLVGLMLAVVGGTLISLFKMQRFVEPFVLKGGFTQLEEESLTRADRHAFALDQVKDIVRKVWIYVIVGVLIGALIHDWIPEAWVTAVLGQDKWYSVPLATLIGVPMYADIFGTLPIAEALVAQGVGLGTVLAFMMAVTTLSLPSIILLKKVVKRELLIFFVAYCTIGIMIIGFVFNAIQGILI